MKYAFLLLAVGCSLSAVHAQWLETTIQLDSGSAPSALCCNPQNNKIYSANLGGDVTVIDGATNQVIATVTVVGDWPQALGYNPQNNRVYCANYGSVTVIDGATNQVLRTIGVREYAVALCHNPVQNRVYVVNCYGSCISVLRDSMPPGVAELPSSEVRTTNTATIVRGSLLLTEAVGGKRLAVNAHLLDVSGRKVLDLKPGPNDVQALAPGVYYARGASAVKREASSVTKVVITR